MSCKQKWFEYIKNGVKPRISIEVKEYSQFIGQIEGVAKLFDELSFRQTGKFYIGDENCIEKLASSKVSCTFNGKSAISLTR